MGPSDARAPDREDLSALGTAVGLLAVMAASVALRAPFFGAPLSEDEGGYAYVAHWWAAGEPLYRSLWIDRPQGIFLAYRLGLGLFGGSTAAIRLFGALWGALTCLAVHLAGTEVLGRRRLGVLAAALFAVASTHPAIEGFIPNAEHFMILPATLSAFVLFRAYRRGPGAGALAVAGAFGGGAFLMKQSGVAALLLAFSYVLLRRARGPAADLRRLAAEGGAVAAGFVAVVGPAVVHGLATAPADYPGAITHLGWSGVSVWSYPLAAQVNAFLVSFARVVPAWAFFLVAAWWSLFGRVHTGLLLWAAWSVAGMTLGGHWYVHYYTQVAPPLAILAAAGLATLWRRRRDGRVFVLGGVATAALAAVLVVQEASYYVAPTPAERFFRVIRNPRYRVQRELAAYLREHTPPDATLYAAYSGVELNYLAGRGCAVKYLFWGGLFYIPGTFDQVLATLADPARRPLHVVDVSASRLGGPRGPDDGRFAAALARHYTKAATFVAGDVDFDVYRSRDGGAGGG